MRVFRRLDLLRILNLVLSSGKVTLIGLGLLVTFGSVELSPSLLRFFVLRSLIVFSFMSGLVCERISLIF